MINFFALVLACSPNVAPETISAIVQIESSYNPYAIGVVDGYLERQPKTKEEAVATANMLYELNYNFSMGLAQINRYNLPRYNISIDEVFDPCTNLRVGALILEECYLRATKTSGEQEALRKAFSCYYSGNFIRGFRPDAPNTLSYVDKVVSVALNKRPTVPMIKVSTNDEETVETKILSQSNLKKATEVKQTSHQNSNKKMDDKSDDNSVLANTPFETGIQVF